MDRLTRRDMVGWMAASVLLGGAATAGAAGDERIFISGASGQLVMQPTRSCSRAVFLPGI